MENKLEIKENEDIDLSKDKNTTLSMRTKESLKSTFKAIEGQTDNDKLVYLLELYEKFANTRDNFNIDNNLDIIEKACNTLKSQIVAISSAVNQQEKHLHEKYIEGVANEMKILKGQIEQEELLNTEIINLKVELEQIKINKSKEIELLQESFEEKEIIILEYKNKIEVLEHENKDLINNNSIIVSKENDYINKLREKDVEINAKELELNKLKHGYENNLNSLENKYKEEIKILEKERQSNEKKFEVNIKDLEKSNAVYESKINSLETHVTNLSDENKQLKIDMEKIRKDAKEEVYKIEKEYKIESKSLETEIKNVEDKFNKSEIEKAKLSSKIENLESNSKMLHEELNGLKQDIKDREELLKSRDAEINKLNISLDNLNKENRKILKEKEKLIKEIGNIKDNK